jgi:hypothetical protein
MQEIAIATAALSLLEVLIPKIQELTLKGAVTPEQQQALLAKYNSLKNAGDAAFSGPEWNLS